MNELLGKQRDSQSNQIQKLEQKIEGLEKCISTYRSLKTETEIDLLELWDCKVEMDILTAYFPQEEQKNEINLDKELENVYYGDGVISDI